MKLVSLLLLLLSLLTFTKTTQSATFKCNTPASCQALVDYTPTNTTTLADIQTLFSVKNFRTIVGANAMTPTTLQNQTILANQTIKIPFPCICSNGTGKSNKRPIYTVQKGDGLDHIARDVFNLLITYQEIADVNNISDVNKIEVGQKLWIPLPCSCDEVDGADVVHYGHVVAGGNTVDGIATQFGTTEATLLKLNGLASPNDLQAGAVLDVPLKKLLVKVVPLTDAADWELRRFFALHGSVYDLSFPESIVVWVLQNLDPPPLPPRRRLCHAGDVRSEELQATVDGAAEAAGGPELPVRVSGGTEVLADDSPTIFVGPVVLAHTDSEVDVDTDAGADVNVDQVEVHGVQDSPARSMEKSMSLNVSPGLLKYVDTLPFPGSEANGAIGYTGMPEMHGAGAANVQASCGLTLGMPYFGVDVGQATEPVAVDVQAERTTKPVMPPPFVQAMRSADVPYVPMASGASRTGVSGKQNGQPMSTDSGADMIAYQELSKSSAAMFEGLSDQLRTVIQHNERFLHDLVHITTERDTAVVERDAMAVERDAMAVGMHAMVAERNTMAAERNVMAVERDIAVAERDAAKAKADAALVYLRQAELDLDLL